MKYTPIGRAGRLAFMASLEATAFGRVQVVAGLA